MKIVACYTVFETKEIEVDDKYCYLGKELNNLTEGEKNSYNKDARELRDKVLTMVKKEPKFFSFEGIVSENTEVTIWDE